MSDEKLEHLLRTIDPTKRRFLKTFLMGAAFAVPIIASYSVKDVAYGGEVCSTTVLLTKTVTTTHIYPHTVTVSTCTE